MTLLDLFQGNGVHIVHDPGKGVTVYRMHFRGRGCFRGIRRMLIRCLKDGLPVDHDFRYVGVFVADGKNDFAFRRLQRGFDKDAYGFNLLASAIKVDIRDPLCSLLISDLRAGL